MQSERVKFSQRLNTALNESGFPESTEGRQSAIAKLLGVNAGQVGEWLAGEAYPKTSKLVKLAKYMRVRSNWLLSGIGDKHLHEDEEQAFRKQLMTQHSEQQLTDDDGAEDANYLTVEALELANGFMKLPYSQQLLIQQLVMELARSY